MGRPLPETNSETNSETNFSILTLSSNMWITCAQYVHNPVDNPLNAKATQIITKDSILTKNNNIILKTTFALSTIYFNYI